MEVEVNSHLRSTSSACVCLDLRAIEDDFDSLRDYFPLASFTLSSLLQLLLLLAVRDQMLVLIYVCIGMCLCACLLWLGIISLGRCQTLQLTATFIKIFAHAFSASFVELAIC